jgi:hypothetical protein
LLIFENKFCIIVAKNSAVLIAKNPALSFTDYTQELKQKISVYTI